MKKSVTTWKRQLPLTVLAFVAYSLGLWALNLFYNKDSGYRYLLILLPMAPAVYLVIASSIRAVTSSDEMQKRILTEAMAFAGVATSLVCLGYSFFRDMGAPEFKSYWAWGLVWILYFVGLAWAKRRYR